MTDPLRDPLIVSRGSGVAQGRLRLRRWSKRKTKDIHLGLGGRLFGTRTRDAAGGSPSKREVERKGGRGREYTPEGVVGLVGSRRLHFSTVWISADGPKRVQNRIVFFRLMFLPLKVWSQVTISLAANPSRVRVWRKHDKTLILLWFLWRNETKSRSFCWRKEED